MGFPPGDSGLPGLRHDRLPSDIFSYFCIQSKRNDMYVYTIGTLYLYGRDPYFEVMCASENIDTLKKRLRQDVQKYVVKAYGEDYKDAFVEYGLTPIDQIDEFWSDEEAIEVLDSYKEFHIFEVPVV